MIGEGFELKVTHECDEFTPARRRITADTCMKCGTVSGRRTRVFSHYMPGYGWKLREFGYIAFCSKCADEELGHE